MKLSNDALDEMLGGCSSLKDFDALQAQLLQRMINRSLDAEMEVHLGYEKHERSEEGRRNNRNGKSSKTVSSKLGEIVIDTPRDRDGSFEPEIVKKKQTRLAGMEDKIISLYAKGLTTRDIEKALVDLYGVTISHTIISQVTEVVLEEAKAWQTRPLDAVYPIVWLDGIVIKAHHGKLVINKSVHVVLAVNLRGEKEVLGLWIAENEGAKFWLQVLTELQQRGVKDMLIACMDGLKGLPDAVQSVFPKCLTQLCIVHLMRASMRYFNSKDAKAACAALKRIYQSVNVDDAEKELNEFEKLWGEKYPSVVRLWRNNWGNIIPFFQFPEAIRKVIYTTNAIESLNMSLRKLTRNRRIFPNDDSILKAMFLAIQEASKKWAGIHHWKPALQTFQIMFGYDRVPVSDI
jgi:putative transposase